MPYAVYKKISAFHVRTVMKPMLDLYAPDGTRRRKILDKHYWLVPASKIDREMGLVPGTAREEIVEFWKWEKKRFKYLKATGAKLETL